jgi:hypothetical protein
MAELQTEGFISLLEGVHGGLSPNLVRESQFAQGLNVAVRGGLVSTRPQFEKERVLASEGKFQGSAIYSLNSGDRFVYCIDGNISIYNLETRNLAPNVATLSATADRVYFEQADRYFVVQDGESRPIFLHEDSLLRQAIPYRAFDANDFDNTFNETFTGTIMAYGHGRIFVRPKHIHNLDGQPDTTTEGRPYFVGGDLFLPNKPENVLKSTETSYLAGGGAFGLPGEFGFVTAMDLFRNAPTGSGQGPLIVFGRRGVAAFGINARRDDWQGLDFSQVLFEKVGTRSDRSVIAVNDDLFFRGEDGIRSIRYTTSQVASGGGSLSVTPLSDEVRHRLELDDATARELSSMSFAQNYVLLTSGGYINDAFRGLISLDTAAAFSLTTTATPAYNDIWTGLNFLQTLSAEQDMVETHFFVHRNQDTQELSLWKLGTDNYRDNVETPTLCRLYTRAFDFGVAASTKKFSHLDLHVRELKGDARVTAYFRIGGYKLWNQCLTVDLKADYGDTGELAQTRYKIKLPPLDENIWDPVTGKQALAGNTIELCIEWEGSLTIEKAVAFALPEPEEPELLCEPEVAQALEEGEGGFLLDDFTYKIKDE